MNPKLTPPFKLSPPFLNRADYIAWLTEVVRANPKKAAEALYELTSGRRPS